MGNKEQPSLDSWDEFTGNWLKAEHIKSFPAETFVTYVNSSTNDKEEGILILDLQYAGKKWKKQLNKTDVKAIKEAGIQNPKAIAEKILIWDKVRVYNPQLKKHQDSIAISGIKNTSSSQVPVEKVE